MKSHISARRRAFTLIELLTVIAIIAVLAAIIFPVFAAVRENARRADCMSNMKTIATSLKQYELDNRKYPDFLFAPAIAKDTTTGGCATINNRLVVATGNNEVCTQEQASATGKLGGDYVDVDGQVVASGGLYPEYIKSRKTFRCANNSWFLENADPAYNENPATPDYPVTAPISTYVASSLDKNQTGTFNDKYGVGTAPDALRFYKFDSYDVSPFIRKKGNGEAIAKLDRTNFAVRYQRQWMPVVGSLPNTTADKARQLYADQLIWRNPSDDAPVAMCSYHAESGKAIVLYLSGTAKVFDIATLDDKELQAVNAGVDPTTEDFDTFKMTP